jgi:hypothetical protein
LELIEATEESVIIRTEIYDRRPLNRWSDQRVTLLGTQVVYPSNRQSSRGRTIDDKGKILTRMLAVE